MRVTIDSRKAAAIGQMELDYEELEGQRDELAGQLKVIEEDIELVVAAIMKQPAFSHWLLMQDNSSSEMWMTQPGNRNQSSIEGKSDYDLAVAWAKEVTGS